VVQFLRSRPPISRRIGAHDAGILLSSDRGMYDHARLFARVSAALADNPGASLVALSAALGIHPHTLASVIRRHTGTSFSVWGTRRRVAAACVLLRSRPELSIKEVASATGFSSTSVFDRFLRRTCGRSPSECRQAPALSSSIHGAPDQEPERAAGCLAPIGAIVNGLGLRQTNRGAQPVPANAKLDSSTASS
jgi:AraC-like DNA-binding protein